MPAPSLDPQTAPRGTTGGADAAGPRLLLVTDERFWRRAEGSHARIAALCRYLADQVGELLVLFVGHLAAADLAALQHLDPRLRIISRGLGPYRNSMAYRVRERLRAAVPRAVKRTLSAALRTWRADPSATRPTADQAGGERHLRDFVKPDFVDLFRQVVAAYRPTLVIVEYVRLSYLMAAPRQRRGDAVRVIDTHDVQSDRQQSFNTHGEPHYLAITPAEEAAALGHFDVVLAIQPRDAARLSQLVPGRPVLTVGHAYPIERLPPAPQPECQLVFIGGPGRANRYALDAFLPGVWAPLRARFGEQVRLLLFGTLCEQLAGLDLPAGVMPMGRVADVRDAYRHATLVVNPVAFGGGLKIKTVEALCHGLALVTTPAGAAGLEDGAGSAFLVCDSAPAMVAALGDLIASSARREALARQALAYALTHFGEAAAYGALAPLLRAHGSPPATTR